MDIYYVRAAIVCRSQRLSCGLKIEGVGALMILVGSRFGLINAKLETMHNIAYAASSFGELKLTASTREGGGRRGGGNKLKYF